MGLSTLTHKAFPSLHRLDWRRTVLAIFIGSLLIRVIFILSLQDGYYFRDSVFYSKAALNLMAHGELGEDYHWPPVYPFFLAGIYAVFGPHIVAVRVVQAALGAALAVMIAMMARRIGGERVGMIAGLLWGIYPLGIFIAGLVYPTTIATLLLLCAVLCLLPPPEHEPSPMRVVVGGVLFGLTILTKFMILVTVIATAMWLMYWKRTHRVASALLFLVAVAVPLILWTAYNGHVSGSPLSIQQQFVDHLPDVGHPPNTVVAADRRASKLALILKHPDEFVINFAWEFYHFWELSPHRLKMNNDAQRAEYHAEASQVVKKTVIGRSWTSLVSMLSVGPMFFLALIGCGTMGLRKEQRRACSLLSMTILSLAIGYSCFTSKMRYRIPIEPYIVMFSAYGLMQVWTVRARWTRMRGMGEELRTSDSASDSGATLLEPTPEGSGAAPVRTPMRQLPRGPVPSSD